MDGYQGCQPPGSDAPGCGRAANRSVWLFTVIEEKHPFFEGVLEHGPDVEQ